MPDGTSRFSYKGETIFHYMGCSTFSNFTCPSRDRGRQDPRGRAVPDQLLHRPAGSPPGWGPVINTAKVEPGANVVVFGLGGIGLNVIQGAKLVGANKIVGVDINPGKEEWGRKFGMTDFIDARNKDRAAIIDEVLKITDGGADYSFDCTGNTEVMRTALECCHRGWGTSIIIGVAESGKEIATRPFQAGDGAQLARDRVRRRQGPHRRSQDRRLVHGREDRDRPDDHPR
jgi:S-(hydroxymethyl)glutathione dehydrogenase/alcohol dehydrogenase